MYERLIRWLRLLTSLGLYRGGCTAGYLVSVPLVLCSSLFGTLVFFDVVYTVSFGGWLCVGLYRACTMGCVSLLDHSWPSVRTPRLLLEDGEGTRRERAQEEGRKRPGGGEKESGRRPGGGQEEGSHHLQCYSISFYFVIVYFVEIYSVLFSSILI